MNTNNNMNEMKNAIINKAVEEIVNKIDINSIIALATEKLLNQMIDAPTKEIIKVPQVEIKDIKKDTIEIKSKDIKKDAVEIKPKTQKPVIKNIEIGPEFIMDPISYETMFGINLPSIIRSKMYPAYMKYRVTYASTSNKINLPVGSVTFNTPGKFISFGMDNSLELEQPDGTMWLFDDEVDNIVGQTYMLPTGRWKIIYLGSNPNANYIKDNGKYHYFELICLK